MGVHFEAKSYFEAPKTMTKSQAKKKFVTLAQPYWIKELTELKQSFMSHSDSQSKIDAKDVGIYLKIAKSESQIRNIVGCDEGDTVVREMIPDSFYYFINYDRNDYDTWERTAEWFEGPKSIQKQLKALLPFIEGKPKAQKTTTRKSKPKAKSGRKAPTISATKRKIGTRMRGNDGNMWEVKPAGKSQRWVRGAETFEAQNPITGESLPLTGQEIVYGFNLNTSEKFEQTLAWLLDQINYERINDGEEYWYFSRQIRDTAWDEMNEMKESGDTIYRYAETFEATDWQRGEHDPTADVVDITADPIRNRVYVTVRFYTKAGLSSYDIIYTGDLKQSGFAESFDAEDQYECVECGSHELRFLEYSNPEYNGFFCMNCGHSPCGINETDNKTCTCDVMQFGKYTWLGEMPRTQFPSYIDVEAFKKQEQDKENERIRIVGSKKKLDAIRKSAETYTNPITGQPNFVLVTEHIRDGEYERYEYFVIDAESEAKMSDQEILEWQYGEGSVDKDAYDSYWVHGERIHELEFQPISLSDALVLERLRVASRNYPYQDRETKKAEGESPDGFNKSLVAIDLEHEGLEYCDYFIVHTHQISGFSEQELVSYFYDLEEEDWTGENTFEPMMSFPTEVESVMVWSITPEEEKVLRKFGISGRY